MANFIISAFADEAAKDLEGQIKALKRNGLRYIEPRNINGAILKKSETELTEIAEQLRENGISVPSLGSPIGNTASTRILSLIWRIFAMRCAHVKFSAQKICGSSAFSCRRLAWRNAAERCFAAWISCWSWRRRRE